MAERRKNSAVRASIHERLLQSGEQEQLQDFLRAQLVECGWRDEMKQLCRETIKGQGVGSVTVDSLVAELAPQGRKAVPAEVRQELLLRIRKFLAAASQEQNLADGGASAGQGGGQSQGNSRR